MAFAAIAAILLFATPTFTFNSKIAVDIDAFSKFVPETEYTKDVDIVKLIGTDTINVGIKFYLDADGISKSMSGDRDKINELVIKDNVNDIVNTLHEPVDLITDFTIRSVIKSTIKAEITKQIANAAEGRTDSTAEEIMDEVGMDEEYFTNFSYSLYDSANRDDATVDLVSGVLSDQIDEAITKAEATGVVDRTKFDETQIEGVKENLVKVLDDLHLVKDDGSLEKISNISYSYLAKYLKEGLQGSVSDEELEQRIDESTPNYADRLLNLFVTTKMPDAFYTGVQYVSLGLFIGLFLFAIVWALLIIITLLRTISNKPWTVWWWFWPIAGLQLTLGLGLTIFGKFIFPKLPLEKFGLPLKEIILAPRTYALWPSILYIVMVVLGFIYIFFKIPAKRQYNKERKGDK